MHTSGCVLDCAHGEVDRAIAGWVRKIRASCGKLRIVPGQISGRNGAGKVTVMGNRRGMTLTRQSPALPELVNNSSIKIGSYAAVFRVSKNGKATEPKTFR